MAENLSKTLKLLHEQREQGYKKGDLWEARARQAYDLAEKGYIEVAGELLTWQTGENTRFRDRDTIMALYSKASARVGIEASLGHAEHFYQKGEKWTARQWLGKALKDSKLAEVDLTGRVSELKKIYHDRLPMFLLRLC